MRRHLVLPSTPESVAEAVHFAEDAAAEVALPPPVVERLLLATSEAVANAIEHGNGSEAGRAVRVGWSIDEGAVVLTVEDEGRGLTLERILSAELPADPYRTEGRGLYLIRILSDRVEVDGPRLRLWFATRPDEVS